MWMSRTHGRLLGALGTTGAGLELLELSLQMRYVLAARPSSGTDWSVLYSRSHCKCSTSSARCCRTCRRFPHSACRPRW
ncbi:hypothetical protein EDB86DRAFT_2954135 [Lactarius hatsudake]|nr:hypothetical protein EDB86DRAFT_2954135 [Lactarius hatsudake]